MKKGLKKVFAAFLVAAMALGVASPAMAITDTTGNYNVQFYAEYDDGSWDVAPYGMDDGNIAADSATLATGEENVYTVTVSVYSGTLGHVTKDMYVYVAPITE